MNIMLFNISCPSFFSAHPGLHKIERRLPRQLDEWEPSSFFAISSTNYYNSSGGGATTSFLKFWQKPFQENRARSSSSQFRQHFAFCGEAEMDKKKFRRRHRRHKQFKAKFSLYFGRSVAEAILLSRSVFGALIQYWSSLFPQGIYRQPSSLMAITPVSILRMNQHGWILRGYCSKRKKSTALQQDLSNVPGKLPFLVTRLKCLKRLKIWPFSNAVLRLMCFNERVPPPA